jgi:tungstate transport system substrate-binding protein
LRKIAESEATFVSRGDESGTHSKELSIWKAAGIEPGGGWYVESGTGMGDTLNIANERDAYTLTDRGTFLSLGDRMEIGVLIEGDLALLNIYHVITVDPGKNDRINAAGASAFLEFLLDPAVQAVIGEFGVDRFGEPLFTPCADNSCGIEGEAMPAPAATP